MNTSALEEDPPSDGPRRRFLLWRTDIGSMALETRFSALTSIDSFYTSLYSVPHTAAERYPEPARCAAQLATANSRWQPGPSYNPRSRRAATETLSAAHSITHGATGPWSL